MFIFIYISILDYNIIEWIMGGVIGGVAIIVLLLIILIIMACRRKRVPMQGVTYEPDTIITQSGSQQIRGKIIIA
jgi:hypothetical protein